MSYSLNKVLLIGNVGQPPEIRQNEGMRIATFSIATTENWMDKNTNERKQKTEWHNIVVFNDKLIDIVSKYLKKGDSVYIEGQIQKRKYTDENNQEKQKTEIVLSRFRGELILLGQRSAGERSSENGTASSGGFSSDFEDEFHL